MSLQHEEDAVRTSRHVRRFQNETPRVAPREDVIPDHHFPPPCVHVCARACSVHSLDVVKALLVLQQRNFVFS
jgi:hypothetical protein